MNREPCEVLRPAAMQSHAASPDVARAFLQRRSLRFPGALLQQRRVRFSDSEGLTLSRTCEFKSDEPPSAMSVSVPLRTCRSDAKRVLRPLFEQPAASADLYAAVRRKGVGLENVLTKAASMIGTVLVPSLAFSKHVFVRVTTDGWVSSADIPATYANSVSTAGNPPLDRFSFTVRLPKTLRRGSRAAFAICCRQAGGEWWDNNDGRDYEIECTVLKALRDCAPGAEAETETNALEARLAAACFSDDSSVASSDGEDSRPCSPTTSAAAAAATYIGSLLCAVSSTSSLPPPSSPPVKPCLKRPQHWTERQHATSFPRVAGMVPFQQLQY